MSRARPARTIALRNADDPLGPIRDWFASKAWTPLPFQEEAWDAYLAGRSGLIAVPTGAGKTFAAFAGPLAELRRRHDGARATRVLYITPLRAVARDIELSLRDAVSHVAPQLVVESRTGDTGSSARARQRTHPPDVLVTTPESLSLMLASPDSAERLGAVRAIIVDEWHELISSKRGTQIELAMARIRACSPGARTWALSATLGNIDAAARAAVGVGVDPVIVRGGAPRPVEIVALQPASARELPWAGHMGLRMLPRVLDALDPERSTLLFANTRSQAELWHGAILASRPAWAPFTALHHGSIDREERERVEAGLKDGSVRIVVATSSLDLGVDFAPVERVFQIGSPKGIARLLQRAGRSGHRPGETARIVCVPTHAMELVEVEAARRAIEQSEVEPREPVDRPLDVLCQHMVTCALGGGFHPEPFYEEVRRAASFERLTREEFDWAFEVVTRGGATLGAYPEFRRVVLDDDGVARVHDRRIAALHRLNVGTITAEPTVPVRFVGGRSVGTIEEGFVSVLRPGQRFLFAGKVLEFARFHDMTAYVRPAKGRTNFTPHWAGIRLPISEPLARGVRRELERASGAALDDATITEAIASFVRAQAAWSRVPREGELLIELLTTREGSHAFVYPFEGRLVNAGLGAIVATRIGRAARTTFGITANDYGFELLAERGYPFDALICPSVFAGDHVEDDAGESLNLGEMARRQFREVARVAGLIRQAYPGGGRSARQLGASSSLLYDVFREFDPENLLLRQARREVMNQQLEHSRLARALARLRGASWSVVRVRAPTPLGYPLMLDRFGSTLSHETLAERIEGMRARWEAGGRTRGGADDSDSHDSVA